MTIEINKHMLCLIGNILFNNHMKCNNNDSRQVSRRMLVIIVSASTLIAFASIGQTVDTNILAPWFTNKSQVWSGETNGFRVGVDVGSNAPAKEIDIFVLSSKKEGLVYVYPPSGKLPKMELRDPDGILVQNVKGKMDGELPRKIPASGLRNGGLFDYHSPAYQYFLLGQNSPNMLTMFEIGNVYHIKKEADYVLTIFPVIYKFETNYTLADRVDLPSVTTKVHLAPLR